MAVQEVQLHDALGDSMLEEIRRTAERRLRQIEPLLEEADRLRHVLDAIEGRSTVRQVPPRADEARGANGILNAANAAKSKASRAAKGSNKRVILELVGQRPGIAVAEISELTGVKRTVVASTVSRLKRYGELREHEQGGLCLAESHATG